MFGWSVTAVAAACSRGCFILVDVSGSQGPDSDRLFATRRLFPCTAPETRTHAEPARFGPGAATSAAVLSVGRVIRIRCRCRLLQRSAQKCCFPRACLTEAPAGGAVAAASGSVLEDRGSILVGSDPHPIRHTTTRVGFQEMLLLLVPVLWLHQRTGAAPSGSPEQLDSGAVSSLLPSDLGVRLRIRIPRSGLGFRLQFCSVRLL